MDLAYYLTPCADTLAGLLQAWVIFLGETCYVLVLTGILHRKDYGRHSGISHIFKDRLKVGLQGVIYTDVMGGLCLG